MAKRTWGPNTWNNYTPVNYAFLQKWITENCSWGGIGREIGDKCGTPHLQFGFTIRGRTMRVGALKKVFGDAPHWEKTLYPEAMARYCAKEGDYWEHGAQEPGKRTDISDTYALLEEGASLKEILAMRPNYQCIQIAKAYKSIMSEPRARAKRKITWIIGPTGVGKSHRARSFDPHDRDAPLLPECDYYSKKANKWWDKYNGERIVIFDDFRPHWFEFDELLRYLDIYHVTGEIKGGTIDLHYDEVRITSVVHPKVMYHFLKEDVHQLMRRITSLIVLE